MSKRLDKRMVPAFVGKWFSERASAAIYDAKRPKVYKGINRSALAGKKRSLTGGLWEEACFHAEAAVVAGWHDHAE